MESPLSQEYINISEKDIRCQAKVLDRARQFRSARLGGLRMTSNFGRSYLLHSNSDLGVIGLYGNPIESRIHSYSIGG